MSPLSCARRAGLGRGARGSSRLLGAFAGVGQWQIAIRSRSIPSGPNGLPNTVYPKRSQRLSFCSPRSARPKRSSIGSSRTKLKVVVEVVENSPECFSHRRRPSLLFRTVDPRHPGRRPATLTELNSTTKRCAGPPRGRARLGDRGHLLAPCNRSEEQSEPLHLRLGTRSPAEGSGVQPDGRARWQGRRPRPQMPRAYAASRMRLRSRECGPQHPIATGLPRASGKRGKTRGGQGGRDRARTSSGSGGMIGPPGAVSLAPR